MGKFRTGFRGGKCCPARISEEVQYLDRRGISLFSALFFLFSYQAVEPFPVYSLLGKDTGVLEREGF